MLLNVRMGTGLLLGTMEAAEGVCRPGMYLDVMAPVRVSVHDGSVPEHDVTAAWSVSGVRLPVDRWVLPGGETEVGLRVNHAGHVAGVHGMTLNGQATMERNMAARTVLLRNRVRHPLWYGPRGETATSIDPWSLVSRDFSNLVYEVMEVWNARLLDITPEYMNPDVEDRVQRVMERLSRQVARGIDAAVLGTLTGTETGRFSGTDYHFSHGPESVGPRRGCPKPRTTTRVYSMVRRALDV